MSTIHLGLGSNLDDRYENINQAINQITNHPCIHSVIVAPLFINPAITPTPQPMFINTVIKAETTLTPTELLHATQTIETQLGQAIDKHLAPRLIDIDILFVDDYIQATPTLTLPHPEISHREFVLKPCQAISPDLIHPVLGLTIQELYDRYLRHHSANRNYDRPVTHTR